MHLQISCCGIVSQLIVVFKDAAAGVAPLNSGDSSVTGDDDGDLWNSFDKRGTLSALIFRNRAAVIRELTSLARLSATPLYEVKTAT